MLAGLPKAPSAQQPDRQPRARARARQLLRHRPHAGERLHHRRAGATPRASRSCSYRSAVATSPVHAEYVAETVRQLIFAQYGDEAYTRGLNVYTDAQRGRAGRSPTRRCARASWTTSGARSTAAPRTTSTCRPNAKELDDAHRRSAGRPPRQRRVMAAVVLEAVAQEGRRRAAERRVASTITGDGLQARRSRACPTRRSPKIADPPRRGDPRRSKTPRTTGRSRSCPRSKAPSSRMDPRDGAIQALVGGFDYAQEQVQPRHAGLAPAGLELQALHLLGRAGKGLHAGDGGQRRAAVLRRRHDRRPALGAEELRRHVRRPDAAAHARWRSRRTWSRSASCKSIGPHYAQDWITRFGFDADKHPAYLTMALGAGSVTPMQMATGLLRCSPTAATASTRCLISRDHRHARARC